MSYLLGIAAIVTSLALGATMLQTKRLEWSQAEVVRLEGELATCGGRLSAVMRDVESDNEIDNLDLLNFDIPADWLLPAEGANTP